jgi:cell division protein FtsB
MMMVKTSWRQTLVLLFCAFGTLYFGYHAFAGRHGLEVRWRLTSELQNAEVKLRRLEAVRTALDRDISLLQSDRLDPDMLDEAARRLGFAHPDDLVMLQR